MADVFVSYKAEDRQRIAPLVQALETDGLSVWWDAHIGGGDAWRETILRNLEHAKCVIVVWSRRSVGPQGEFVRDEATHARKRNTYFPIRIDKVDPPLGFGETQSLDMSGWKGDRGDQRYDAILSGLRLRFGLRVKRSRAPVAEQHGVNRWTAIPIAVAGVAVLAGAGAGAWYVLKPITAQSHGIAVLPFANLSGDPAQSYFSDGIAEELRGDLSRISGLQVIARTSSEAVRDADAKTAATKLGVTNILTGSVRRSATMIRVSAELVNGKQGVEQWSQTYDRAPGDALQIQTEIATKVVEALKVQLGDFRRDAIVQGDTANAAAQDLLLQARAISRRDDSDTGLQKALALLNSALTLDPRYADALVMKAQIVTGSAEALPTLAERARRFSDGEELAREAVGIAPRSFAARGELATSLFLQLKMREAFQQVSFIRSALVQNFPDPVDLQNYSSSFNRLENSRKH